MIPSDAVLCFHSVRHHCSLNCLEITYGYSKEKGRKKARGEEVRGEETSCKEARSEDSSKEGTG